MLAAKCPGCSGLGYVQTEDFMEPCPVCQKEEIVKRKKPEVTSKRVSAIAGRVLERLKGGIPRKHVCRWVERGGTRSQAKGGVTTTQVVVSGQWEEVCSIADLKALAASALTQAADKLPADENCVCHRDSNGTKKCPVHRSKPSDPPAITFRARKDGLTNR